MQEQEGYSTLTPSTTPVEFEPLDYEVGDYPEDDTAEDTNEYMIPQVFQYRTPKVRRTKSPYDAQKVKTHRKMANKSKQNNRKKK